ncbi:glutamyl-tRNA reductase [Embleya scabrispora]|uniref:glutamyl-tRNA reductase n=1 Tax=Embleya scabrispora TaxID=159449 RepID=UPI0003A3A928|nr:glutamyl-tRNA reductase [Embleya scabrispora]MYS81318.1 glutamyl-tRNA reductase [Streptomyces sp. SID5474]
MSVLAVGLSHRTAEVSLLERVSVTGTAQEALLHDLIAAEPVGEAVLLSTCNRVEVYADVDRFHGGVTELGNLLSRHTGVPVSELTPCLYVHYEDRAVQHLFSVACGLDSMVVGEGQILGQIKAALALAQTHGTAGRVLNELTQQALRVGKRAHTETGIDQAGRSLMTVGLAQAEQSMGPVEGCRALVVGAGSMSALAAKTLHREGVGHIVVANRTYERAEHLAESVAGRAVPMSALPDALSSVDLVVSCTGAAGLVIGRDEIEAVLAVRRERGVEQPLVLIDLALPRDIDPGARDLDGVVLIDLERLAEVSAGSPGEADVDLVRKIVCEEVAAFATAQQAQQVAPTVVALRSMGSDVVRAELDRLSGRVPEMDDRVRTEVEQTVRRVVDKLLHAPTVRVKQLAGEPGGSSYADALRMLFDLDPGTPEVVRRADAPDAVEGVA